MDIAVENSVGSKNKVSFTNLVGPLLCNTTVLCQGIERVFRRGFYTRTGLKSNVDEPVAMQFPDVGNVFVLNSESLRVQRSYPKRCGPFSLQAFVDFDDFFSLPVGQGD